MSSPRLLAALLSLAALPGCKGCRSERPYTPFGVASSLPDASTSAPSPSASAAASAAPMQAPALAQAQMAPPGAKRWEIAGRTLEAPAGRVFEQAVVFDATDAPTRAVATWTLPEAQGGAAGAASESPPPGELWFFAADGSSRALFTFPTFLPTGPGTTAVTALSRSGTELVLSFAVASTSTMIARAPTRAVAVVHTDASAAPAFGLRAADPAPGERFALELAPQDADGDGRDDFRVLARFRAGDAAELAVPLVWFDRAAGPSRDARQPRDEVTRLLRNALVQAKRTKQAAGALNTLASLRRLLASLCAEGGTPRVFDWDGSPLACGNLSTVAELMTDIEVTAALTQGDGGAALAALARDGWYFGKLGDKARAAIVTRIEQKLVPVAAAVRRIDASPGATPPTPHYSPLAFASDGALLVQTSDGVRRFAADGSAAPSEPDAGPAPWPLDPTFADGTRWIGATYACDRSEVVIELAGGGTPSQPTALLSPRPGLCRGGSFAAGFAPTPVLSAGGIEALVGGALVRVGAPSGAAPPGSARSADGSTLAIPTPLGLWVAGARSALWKIDGWRGTDASGCVAANGGTRAACVHGGHVELYEPSGG